MFIQKLKKFLGWNPQSVNEHTSETSKEKGIIKFFNRKRGFGFISANRLNKDIFVHISEAEGRLREGDKVRFELDKNEKGLIAKNVELVSR